jgi:hypothetical protein
MVKAAPSFPSWLVLRNLELEDAVVQCHPRPVRMHALDVCLGFQSVQAADLKCWETRRLQRAAVVTA